MKPHLKQTSCSGQLNAVFLARMEHLLSLSALPDDPQHPVICYDERPCFLIGDTLAPLPMTTGKVTKEHDAYEKHGSCAVRAAIEPLTGARLAKVKPQRMKKEDTEFCEALVVASPNAKKIRLVQDNLNTHNASSCYEDLPAAAAFALAARFEFNDTPKAASWLNLIEIEFSALSRQCLDRRIPTIEQLGKEVLALVKERAEKKIRINWQFSIETARTRLNKHYTRVNANNNQYKET